MPSAGSESLSSRRRSGTSRNGAGPTETAGLLLRDMMRRTESAPPRNLRDALALDLVQVPAHHVGLAEVAHHRVGGFDVGLDHPEGGPVGVGLADLLDDGQGPR
jgi:hypothetical protein